MQTAIYPLAQHSTSCDMRPAPQVDRCPESSIDLRASTSSRREWALGPRVGHAQNPLRETPSASQEEPPARSHGTSQPPRTYVWSFAKWAAASHGYRVQPSACTSRRSPHLGLLRRRIQLIHPWSPQQLSCSDARRRNLFVDRDVQSLHYSFTFIPNHVRLMTLLECCRNEAA